MNSSNFHFNLYLKNFRCTSVDPGRLFSLGCLTKNYLQSRLIPENHDRNVFVAKNEHDFS